MKNSNAPLSNDSSPRGVTGVPFALDLPDGRDFDPEPKRSNPDAFIEFCEQLLPILMNRPGFWERREAERCPAEFDLADPSRVPVSYPAEFIDELLRREEPPVCP